MPRVELPREPRLGPDRLEREAVVGRVAGVRHHLERDEEAGTEREQAGRAVQDVALPLLADEHREAAVDGVPEEIPLAEGSRQLEAALRVEVDTVLHVARRAVDDFDEDRLFGRARTGNGRAGHRDRVEDAEPREVLLVLGELSVVEGLAGALVPDGEDALLVRLGVAPDARPRRAGTRLPRRFRRRARPEPSASGAPVRGVTMASSYPRRA